MTLPMKKELIIVCMSDTHALESELDVPAGDLLLHAGDWTMFSRSLAEIRAFNEWLGTLPHRFRILTMGNHESFWADPEKRSLISNATVLINETATVMGLKVWASPVTPMSGAFGMPSKAERKALYSTIPEDTDVMVTHGPPFGILDRSPGETEHQGDQVLLAAVKRIQPKLLVCGHVHGGYGTAYIGDTLAVNAALLGPDGALSNRPVVLRLPLAR